jgi:hypothetical protein
MAGMFDFKSAEQILAERQEKTRQNTLGLIRSSQQGMKSSEKAASNLGAMLTNLVISQFGGKSEAELLTDARDMGETTQAMEQAGVGGEGSSYGAGVQQQAQAEEQRRIGLLPQEMQEAVGEERRAKQLQQQFSSIDMKSPEALQEGFKAAVTAGNTELANVYGTMYKQSVANKQAEQAVEKKRIFSDVQQQVASEVNPTKDPIGFNQAMFNRLSSNPLTFELAKTYQDNLLKIGNDNMQKKADAANKPYTPPNANVIKTVSSSTVNDSFAKDLSDNDLMNYNLYISSRATELLKQVPLDQAMSMARQEAQAGVKKGEEGWFLDDPDTFTSPRTMSNQGNGDWSIEEAN